MARTVSDVMTATPITIGTNEPIHQAAQMMREYDIGDVLVLDAGRLAGVVTDRDLVVRVVADRKDLTAPVGEVASTAVATVAPDTPLDDAVTVMRQQAIRRLPVLDDAGTLVGVLSLGDLAIERDERSALADISAAEPNT